MFYQMNRTIMFAAASLILVVGITVVALPSPVEASPSVWCSGPNSDSCIYPNKGQCQNSLPKGALNTCHKLVQLIP